MYNLLCHVLIISTKAKRVYYENRVVLVLGIEVIKSLLESSLFPVTSHLVEQLSIANST